MTMADAQQSRGLAQGKLDARYTVTLGGLPIGQGAWVIEIGEDHFTASASGATAGLMRVFASGQGQSAARGGVSSGQLIPSSYASRIVTDEKSDEVRMTISSGTVKEFVANPPTVASPDRVPVTEAHRRGVSDPMTASLMRVPGSGDTLRSAGVPAHARDLRRSHALRFAAFLQAARASELRAGLPGRGRGLCGPIFADRGAHSGSRCHQVSHSVARHRAVACADRRHARHGALPGFGSDPARESESCRRPSSSRSRNRARRPPRRSDRQIASRRAKTPPIWAHGPHLSAGLAR